jgi:hypothetical protein
MMAGAFLVLTFTAAFASQPTKKRLRRAMAGTDPTMQQL